jgi:hypothetical protein
MQEELEKVATWLSTQKPRKPSKIEEIKLGYLMYTNPAQARFYVEITNCTATERDLARFRRELFVTFDLHTFRPEVENNEATAPEREDKPDDLDEQHHLLEDATEPSEGEETAIPADSGNGGKVRVRRVRVCDRGVGPTQDDPTQLAKKRCRKAYTIAK